VIVSACLYNQAPPIYFTDYQYSAGFHGLGGLLNPWLDAAYFAPTWHLPHPALVKGKISRRRVRKKMDRAGKNISHFYVSRNVKKVLKESPRYRFRRVRDACR